LGPPPYRPSDLQRLEGMGVMLPKVLPDGGRLEIGPGGFSRSSLRKHRYTLHTSRRMQQLQRR
jgi:hypothetical protein